MIDVPVGTHVGGMTPKQKECFGFSAVLTWLDLRVAVDGDEVRNSRRVVNEVETAGEVGGRASVGSVAGRYVAKAFESLRSVFEKEGWVLAMWIDEGVIHSRLSSEGKTFTEAAARDMTRGFEERLRADGDIFSWNDMAQNIVEECKAVLAALPLCDPSDPPTPDDWEKGVHRNIDKPRIASITATPIVPVGLPQMEFGFSAGGSQILYPNPMEFTDEHWELWSQFSPFKTRGLLDVVYAAAVWLPHEVLHCVQDGALNVAGAVDGTKALHNWQCEYCVCSGQGLFTAMLIGEQRKKGIKRTLMLPAHFLEESLLWLDACVGTHPSGPPSEWLSSKGSSLPSENQPYEFMEDAHAEYLTLLGRVVINSFQEYQALVEKDEQETSYWAEFVKYANKLLQTTSQDKIPEVTASVAVA